MSTTRTIRTTQPGPATIRDDGGPAMTGDEAAGVLSDAGSVAICMVRDSASARARALRRARAVYGPGGSYPDVLAWQRCEQAMDVLRNVGAEGAKP